MANYKSSYTGVEIDAAIAKANNAENVSNKVVSLSANSTDTEYPSAKCVYDLIGDIEEVLTTLTTGGGVE